MKQLGNVLKFFITMCFVWFSGLLVFAQTSAKINGLLIQSENMYRDTENEVVELEGGVQIAWESTHLAADKAKLLLRGKKIELEGRALITSPKTTIGGDRMVIDYENNTGIIYNGYVKAGNVLFEGTVIQKTGVDDYFVTGADYTTCTNCPSSWSFSGQSIRAELGGYAYIKNTTMRIGSVPVLWLPYLIVPLKSDRQSGLLTPGIESSSQGGVAISQGIFWAISRSEDATFTFKNYEKRSLKLLTNYRYILNENSGGEIDFALIRDRAFINENRVSQFRPVSAQGIPINRWFIKYNHNHTLPQDWIHRVQLNNASDLQYAKDFSIETKNHSDSLMENRMSVTKNTPQRHFSIDSSYYINLIHSDPLSGNGDAVHRLPEIRWSRMPEYIGQTGLLWNFDFDYVNFTRSSSGYDNLTLGTASDGSAIRYQTNNCNNPKYTDDTTCAAINDGAFNASDDLIRTAQRIDFNPTISRPFTLASAFDIVPSIGYRETHYFFPVGDERYHVRRMLRTELKGRATFSRVFGDLENSKSERFKHEIQPEITFTGLPYIQQKNLSYLGWTNQNESPYFTSDSVNDAVLATKYGLQFDYNDRIFDRSLITYSLTNKIIQKRWISDMPSYRQLAIFRLSQSFDAFQDSQNDPLKQPWSDIAATLDLRLDKVQSNVSMNYYPNHYVTKTSSRVRLLNEQGDYAELGLVRDYTIVPGKAVDLSTRSEDYTFKTAFTTSHINLIGKIIYDANAKSEDRRIKSWAYVAQLKPPGECWAVNFLHDQPAGGDTTYKLDFEFVFDGKAKPPLPDEMLARYGF